MDTKEIESILKFRMKGVYVGVYASDELPQIIRRPLAIVINTDPSDKPGTHWTALYITREGYGEFFDTRGIAPDHRVRSYLNKKAPRGFEYNQRRIQSPVTTICGMYCIEFLVTRHYHPRLSFSTILRYLYTFEDPWLNDLETYKRFQETYGEKPRPLIDVRLM